ncbi:hypothetical protein MMC08_003679 [Hypocenomyce scalaris]|nr:hypothetical protein [Hypocenomyce scalaris]
MDGPFHVTFGIELEIIIFYETNDYLQRCNKAFGEGQHLIQRVEQTLQRHIVDVLRAYRFAVNHPNIDNTDNWTVSQDGSVKLDYGELPPQLVGCDWFPLELKSPAYPYSSKALTEVRRAVEVVRGKFRTIINNTCGIHIHLGNHDRGFDLETVKNLALLVTVFERQFNQLHPPHRISAYCCEAPTLRFPSHNIWEVARAIEAIPSIEDFVYLFCTGGPAEGIKKDHAYNLCNLHYTGRRTIEFRQHTGTLDTDAILAWINMTCKLVIASHEVGPVGFIELVKEHANESDFTVIDLLHNLGFEELAEYYNTRTISHPRHKCQWVEPLTGEWLTLPTGNESSREGESHSNDDSGNNQGGDDHDSDKGNNNGSEGSQDENNYLHRLYKWMDWNGEEVTDNDVRIISETSWKDF